MKILFAIILSLVYCQTYAQDHTALKTTLDSIYHEDQKYRIEISKIAKEHGWESEQTKSYFKVIAKVDSLNLIKVEQILNEYGWIGENKIGTQANTTLFLVIQHANLITQEKYLPMLREAVEKGNATASSLAMLEDRVAVRKGKLQLYGSQIGRDLDTQKFFVYPLSDPEKVDERRRRAGLTETLAEYVTKYGITWDASEYINKLPEYEKMAQRLREKYKDDF